MQESLVLNGKLEIALPQSCMSNTVKEILNGFFYHAVEISYVSSDGLFVRIGTENAVELTEGEGIISVSNKGVYITAINERALLNCLFLLLQKVVAENLSIGEERLLIPVGREIVNPRIARRMLHLCVVPNVPLTVYKKIVRLASVLGYTHILFEFWGSFQYECLKELSWKDKSFSKDEIAEILQEAKDLKVEIVPMINHFGHASASRMNGGKHVVLDQNPRLATLFSPDGWWWRFERKEVRILLKNMRRELYELFGEGTYFHLGFDESFSYPSDETATDILCDYMRDLCEEVLQEGRIPMLWGDQFLHEPTLEISPKTGYEGNAHSQEIAEKLLNSVPKEAIICDWQYFVKEGTWKSAKYLVEKSCKVMTCPWIDIQGFNTAVETAETLDCYGVLHTTWDKIFSEAAVYSLFHAHDVFYKRNKATKKVGNNLVNATLLRKICFADGDYEKAGWVDFDFQNKVSK